MGKKKFALLGVCVMICLLIMSAMSGSLLGYSNAWFTSSAQADASITANFLTLEDIAEVTLNGEIPNLGKGKKSAPIDGSITSNVDGLKVEYEILKPQDEGQLDAGMTVYSITNLPGMLVEPVSPILLSESDLVTFTIHTHITGNTPQGIYKGQLELTFTVGEDVLKWVVPLKIVVQ